MTTAAPSRWQHALTSAAERNATIDLSPAEATDDQRHVVARSDDSFEATDRPTWRVRILRCDAESIVVERPMVGRSPVSLQPDRPLAGVLMQGDTRWSFDTRVLGPLRLTLADEVEVMGVRLSMPAHVHVAQRRDFYRVESAAAVTEPVRVAVLCDCGGVNAGLKHNRLAHRLAGRGDDALVAPPAPSCADAFAARVVDLSGGGLCVSAAVSIEPLLITLPTLWVDIRLPGSPHPIYAIARVAHWRRECDRLLVGLAFCFDHDREHGPFIADLICRFTAEQQRLQLNRQH